MFSLYFHYEDVSRQDPLLKPNHANVMEVPGSCEIRVVPKSAIIHFGSLSDCASSSHPAPFHQPPAPPEPGDSPKKNHIRHFLLITLIHVERGARSAVTKEIIKERVLRLYKDTKTIIISIEPHRDGGLHYHAGISTRVSRHTAAKMLRSVFPEWGGMSFDLQFRKGWPVICSYVTKEDPNFLVWGASRADILNLARLHRNHRRRREPPRSPKPKRKPDAYRLACPKSFPVALPKKILWLRKKFFIILFYHFLGFLLGIMDSELFSPLVGFFEELIKKIRNYFFPPPPTTFEKIKKLFSAAGWRIVEALKAVFFDGG